MESLGIARCYILLLATAFAISAFNAAALEASAGTKDPSAAGAALEMRADALATLLTTTMNAMLACNRDGMVYAPSDSAADARGCVDMPIVACARRGMRYRPGAPGSDAMGCQAASFAADQSAVFSAGTRQTVALGSDWTFCAVSGFRAAEENHACQVTLSNGQWKLFGGAFYDPAICYARCFRLRD